MSAGVDAAAATGFAERFFEGLLGDLYRYQPAANREWRPNGSRGSVRAAGHAAADLGLRIGQRVGLARRHFEPREAAARLAEIVTELPAYERTYELLADEHSRAVLVDLLRFRVLGPEHVRLPITVREFEESSARVERECLRDRDTATVSDPLFPTLNRYEWPGREGVLRFDSHTISVVSTFDLEQYRYAHGPVEVAAHPGDVAIDAGGCWGDTALYLADRVGPDGRVLCFEFTPENVAVIRRNLDLNEALAARVEIVEQPLWSESGETLEFSQAGAFTSLAMDREGGAQHATTVALDEFAERAGLDRVDFVKMDIEGAEIPALRGAERVLGTHRPTLALAAYHYDRDLIDIPAFLADLDVGYRFHLDHFSAGRMETVLFATAR